MLIVIRISGMVDVPENVQYALNNINLRRKYSAILMQENPENVKLLNKVRSFVAYGKISDENLMKLISLRAESLNAKCKINVESIIKGLEKKSLRELDIKPFFRLHPPRKGIESKKHFGVGRGVLGDNKEHINALLERML
ncbi:MAG: uL30 family ribosomal protein [Nanoarchaeota archaeon]